MSRVATMRHTTVLTALIALAMMCLLVGQASASSVIEHAMGTTEIDGTPQRIVTLTQHATEAALALGITPVGAVSSWKGDPWYPFIADRMEGVTLVGGELEPELETIFGLRPDLIIGSKSRHEAIYDKLAAIAPTVFHETAGMVWRENLILDAQATGRTHEAERLLESWDERLVDFKSKMGDRLATDVSIVRFRSNGVRIYLTGFPGSVIQAAGLQRPQAQYVEDWSSAPQHITITKEQIPMMDGDVLFYFADAFRGREEASNQMRDDWLNHPLAKNLKAVRTGDVFAVDEIHWNLSGSILSANVMLDNLYTLFLGE